MILDKGTSEGLFISVIYHFIVELQNGIYHEPLTRDEEEAAARKALELHKEYWHLCEKESKK